MSKGSELDDKVPLIVGPLSEPETKAKARKPIPAARARAPAVIVMVDRTNLTIPGQEGTY